PAEPCGASAHPVQWVTPAGPSRQLAQSWSAETGSTLRDTLEAWAKRARWTVRWEPLDLNYPIEAPLTFHGSFEDAVSELFPLYDAAERPFLVNASRPQSLIIIKERKN
ncbi:toxin co-regulated pilus biosynthesis Q family protein, partial [Pseudomonas aeruginosa]